MTEKERIVASLSPLELMLYAEIGGRLTSGQLLAVHRIKAEHEAALRQRWEIARAVRIALEIWWDRPDVLDGLWPKKGKTRAQVRLEAVPLPRLERRKLAVA